MKKPSVLAEMIAKKAFESPQFQQSWQVHMQAFAPILEPAYPDCYTARVHITNILNKISRQDISGARSTMETLAASCGCEAAADKALMSFMQGLCCEVSGDMQGMMGHYAQAGWHGHLFYLPHLKIARFVHQEGQLDIALHEYAKGLRLIRELPEGAARTRLLAATLSNIASCLTYMHRYQDAEAALQEARQNGAVPRLETVEAVLMAATDRADAAEECLAVLAEANDPDYDSIRTLTQEILAQAEPHFYPQPINREGIAAFWQWFTEQEDQLLALYEQRDEQLPEEFVSQIAAQLEPCFPFEHRELEISVHEDDNEPALYFCDGYSRSLAEGFALLFAACPAAVSQRWTFTIEH